VNTPRHQSPIIVIIIKGQLMTGLIVVLYCWSISTFDRVNDAATERRRCNKARLFLNTWSYSAYKGFFNQNNAQQQTTMSHNASCLSM
jgi:hypothetical protein